MKGEVLKKGIVFLLIIVMLQSATLIPNIKAATSPDVFVGIDIAYNTSVSDIKNCIDQYSQYTNCIEFGCTGLTENVTNLNEVCQYAFDKGMYFMVFTDKSVLNDTNAGYTNTSYSIWASRAKIVWGDKFLGLYVLDELGGYQIDLNDHRIVLNASSFSDCTNQFVGILGELGLPRFRNSTDPSMYSLFTSDYALYWFDYAAGYDTVFAQFGWGSDTQLNIALCRGAAAMHNKDWGAIITWTSTDSEQIKNGTDLFNDLVLAYENGAKYIHIFDSNKAYNQSTLTDNQKQVLRDFWQYIQTNPRQPTPVNERVAFVAPKYYGVGFTGVNNKIWGLWDSEHPSTDPYDMMIQNNTALLYRNLNASRSLYGDKLDIIYDDNLSNNCGYSKLIYWNDTSFAPTSTPTGTTTTQIVDITVILVIGIIVAAVALPAFILRRKPKENKK